MSTRFRISLSGALAAVIVCGLLLFFRDNFLLKKNEVQESGLLSPKSNGFPLVVENAGHGMGDGLEKERGIALADGQRARASAEPPGDRKIIDRALVQATIDPFEAMESVVRSVRSDELMDGAVLAIVDIWAERKPSQAAEFIEQLPEGYLREEAADHLAGHWRRINPTVAYIWMKGSVESDRLLANLAGQP